MEDLHTMRSSTVTDSSRPQSESSQGKEEVPIFRGGSFASEKALAGLEQLLPGRKRGGVSVVYPHTNVVCPRHVKPLRQSIGV